MKEINQKIIHEFYRAFQKKDAETMLRFYAPEVRFEDPAFGVLKEPYVSAMWKMLCASATDLKIDFKILSTDENSGEAYWEASYTFKATGRKVLNKIHAHFIFKDGLIIEHKDSFDLYKWAKQAIGWKGFLLGFTPFFKNKLNIQTGKMLDKFLESNA